MISPNYYGIQLGWIIDPSEQSVLVYLPKQQPAFFEAATDVLPVLEFAQAFQLTLGEFSAGCWSD